MITDLKNSDTMKKWFNSIERFVLLMALSLCVSSAWGGILPVNTASGKTSVEDDVLKVYIDDYGTIYPKSKSGYSYTTKSGTPAIIEFAEAGDDYLSFTLASDKTDAARVYTITYGSDCATLSFDADATVPTRTACAGNSVTLTASSPTATTVTLSWALAGITTENVENITISVDKGNPIVLTKLNDLSWPTSCVIADLIKGMEHTFDISVYYTGGSAPLTSSCVAVTDNTSGCSFTSNEIDTKDDEWKNKCSFGSDYTLEMTTTTKPLAVTVSFTVPSDIRASVGNNVYLAGKSNYLSERVDIPDAETPMTPSGLGDGVFSYTIDAEMLRALGVRAAGDSLLLAVKCVASCAEGMYCTKFVGYAVAVGCNEASSFKFTKRTEDQNTFTFNTNADVIRFAYKRSGSTEGYTYKVIDDEDGIHTYTLNIADLDLGSYEFILYDKNGSTSPVKVIQAVY